MISGSQHWWNKADCALTVYRDLGQNDPRVEIHVQKVRFKHVGKIGLIPLTYNRVVGTYSELRSNLASVG
jgi:twinkle protein